MCSDTSKIPASSVFEETSARYVDVQVFLQNLARDTFQQVQTFVFRRNDFGES